ncbi:RNA pseudouridine synthase [Marinifilum breve]|uniref:RNA pseudouridine synthase n=1 Tax=Marinifilum breve TaxID=2184082 RepID=A0A2V4A3L5_9BACT|nr:RluA family pseudouridine synthase [Marinifilum breve]PXY03182.1 RNA pseudouridine synthase [Marinifilum breve]
MHCFITFNKTQEARELPKSFTNPFNYTPHPLCIQAAKELQDKIGMPNLNFKGKMYGVLIVKNHLGELGYIAAYSGNYHSHETKVPFVPQVFEITNPNGFFRKGEAELNQINQAIYKAENSPTLKQIQKELDDEVQNTNETLKAAKLEMANAKKVRQGKRAESENHPNKESILKDLVKESQTEKSKFNKLKKECKRRVEGLQLKVDEHYVQIKALKQARKTQSAQLQKQIFDSYLFLNIEGKEKSASDIFKETEAKVPPAGTGDCCAPKLLQYAFQNQLQPIAMAEFWWGNSPKKEIRKHAYFYPACKSKCEPILGHMLEGLVIEKSKEEAKNLAIKILHEDNTIAIINKPSGLLSVPGKEEQESVYTQVKTLYPDADGPLIVHRLDMATSGLMLIAKTKSAHENLQKQFLNKNIQKRYVALLDGIIKEDSGSIDLPLRVDLDDRPRQLVCFEHGKSAFTKWNIVERTSTQSRIHFYPITGRTHQLRVHAAHPLGLNTPIVGDLLYGLKADRLKLHAEEITFVHPVRKKRINFTCLAEF